MEGCHALLLRPEDRLWPIYRSYYPQEYWWQRFKPDELEMETLVCHLKREAPVASVDRAKPAISRHFKAGHFR